MSQGVWPGATARPAWGSPFRRYGRQPIPVAKESLRVARALSCAGERRGPARRRRPPRDVAGDSMLQPLGSIARLLVALAALSGQKSVNGHSVAMTKRVLALQPVCNLPSLDPGLQAALLRVSLCIRRSLKAGSIQPSLPFDGFQISLKRHSQFPHPLASDVRRRWAARVGGADTMPDREANAPPLTCSPEVPPF